MTSPKRNKPAKTSNVLTAKNADKYALYEFSVQSPEEEVEFITQQYKRVRKRLPVTYREDFCGTAAYSTAWVRSRPERRAIGLDLEPKVLAWAREHHVKELGPDAARLTLLQQDVRQPIKEKVDVVCAYNYSWWIFKERAELLRYFKSVRSGLKPDGMFFLDTFGGATSEQVNLEPRNLRRFTYVWEQERFDPITHDFTAHIHFEFKDGSRLERAFTYEWRHWKIPEARDVLLDAGFKDVIVFWENENERGEPNGHFSPRKEAESVLAFNAYIVGVV